MEDPNKCSTRQIMRTTSGTCLVCESALYQSNLHWIPSHKDRKLGEDANVAIKQALEWKRRLHLVILRTSGISVYLHFPVCSLYSTKADHIAQDCNPHTKSSPRAGIYETHQSGNLGCCAHGRISSEIGRRCRMGSKVCLDIQNYPQCTSAPNSQLIGGTVLSSRWPRQHMDRKSFGAQRYPRWNPTIILAEDYAQSNRV